MSDISWRTLVVLAGVAVVVYATAQIPLEFVALFLALVATSVLRPLVDLLDRVMPRVLAVAAALLTALLVISGLVAFVVESVAGQWPRLTEQFTQGVQDLLSRLQHLPFGMSVTSDRINGWISQGQQWVEGHEQELANRVATGAAESAGTLFDGVALIALTFFCSIFFLARGTHIWEWFINQLPARVRHTWERAGGAAWYTFSGFTRGTVLVALADAILAGTLLVVLGMPLAAPLAVLVFIGAFIPLVGAPAAMVVATVVALATQGPMIAVIVAAGIILIGQIEGHVLSPLIMGKQVSLHPLAIALAVTTGTLLAGILGAVIVIPIVAVTWSVYSQFREADPPMTSDEMAEIRREAVIRRQAHHG